MVVVAVGGGGGGGWGTWEELVLGGAVLRHGGAAWATVAEELRTRSPCTFSAEAVIGYDLQCKCNDFDFLSRTKGSPETIMYALMKCDTECEAKFAEIQLRYSACKSLQSVIQSLSNSKHVDGSSEYHTSHTESCPRSENTADTNSSGKETSRDRSSAASFTEEASNSQKSQKVQQCDTDSIQAINPSPDESYPQAQVEKVGPKDGLLWGSRKQRGGRARRTLLKGGDSSGDGEPTSTAFIQREGSSKGCMKNFITPKVEPVVMKKGVKIPKVESGVMNKDLKTSNVGSGIMKKCLKTPNAQADMLKKDVRTPKAESDVIKKGLKIPKVEPDVMKKGLRSSKAECGQPVIERVKLKLAEILNTISTQDDCKMLQCQLDTQRKRARYKKMIRRHMDFRMLHSKIKSGAISCTKELLRDVLIFINNVITFYPKATLEHMAAVELRESACKTVKQSASLFLKSHGEIGTAGAPVVKNTRVLQPRCPGPGDARPSKVSSRDATAREGDGKRPSDQLANQKTIQRNEPAKKRGVGRPPKSGHRIAGAQEDSPIKGRKRGAGAQEGSPINGRKRGAGAQLDSPGKGRKRSAAAQENNPSKGGKKSRR
ncbi:hypothetical protein Zm00014a_042429 [Zea mays]|uniref:Bromo domain-containing protein n=1 Tax=Zea mays TaxID=4577 RepID=A0A3L6E061_MAIZE|nr:hypothetical protein Zm00014a_042429 [Zea mays]